MAQKTYVVPLTNPELVARSLCSVILHLQGWKAVYNIDFVSIVRVGPNVEVTFSDPLPQEVLNSLRVN